MEKLNLNGRLVGSGEPPYFIAEIGSNHNGDMALCRRLIDAAKEAGAEAVKFQSWSKQSLICKVEYARNTEYADKHRHFGSLEQMCEKYQLTREQHFEAAEYCRQKEITFLSTPFSPVEADLLEELDVPCFKVASMDVNHLPLLEHIGRKGKPVLLSTGMATLGEIERAVGVLNRNGSGPICLLHCIAIYPPAMADVHLNNIPMLSRTFDVAVGFSDHSIGGALALAAIALGACVIEKHFTLDKEMEGWDHWISAAPEEMAAIVREGRNVFSALGRSVRTISPAEQQKKKAFRRRIVLRRDVGAGHKLIADDLDYKRPGTGIDPDKAEFVIGRTVKQAMAFDEELDWEDLC